MDREKVREIESEMGSWDKRVMRERGRMRDDSDSRQDERWTEREMRETNEMQNG